MSKPNLSLVYAIGIPTVIAIGSILSSVIWLTGNWVYSAYLLNPETKIEQRAK
jgi:hypothetical protein